jgi:hypothetical protein
MRLISDYRGSDRIWDGQRSVCNSQRPSDACCKPGGPDRFKGAEGVFVGEVIAASPERHFWVRNAAYGLTNFGNSLISQ